MSVSARKLPPMRTVLGELDTAARQSAQAAGRVGVNAVRAVLPAGPTGNLRKGTRASTKRTGTGYELEIGPRSTPAYASGVTPVQVWRWVDEGTGIYRGGRPIRPRHPGGVFRLPHGWSGQIKGQRPQRIMRRAESSSTHVVTDRLERGAVIAAARMERVLGG